MANKYANITIEPIVPVHIDGNEEIREVGSGIDIEVASPDAKLNAAPKKKDHMGLKAKSTVANTAIYIILVLMTIIWLAPFVCIFIESFETRIGGPAGYLWPEKWGFDNYVKLFTNTEWSFGRWFLNTFIMGVFVAIFQTVFVLSMSCVLSRMRFRGRKGLMNFMLILGMFPGFLTLILLYKVLADLNLTGNNSIWGLILVYVASSGMGYYVSKGFFDTIPKSLDEAARVDGATRAQIFFKITLPMAKPIIIYTVLMGFMAPWGDFVLASYIAHGVDSGMNVAVGMQKFISLNNIGTNYRQFCAAGVIVSIPITALFMFLQKYYVEGVTGGAVKG